MSNKSKLAQLSEIEGMDEMDLIEAGVIDSVCYGICMNEDCDYTTEVEPDQHAGWCENCNTNTVKSACVLAGIR